ncbi:SURF1 family protein [uncultured Amnibacterium sp.]|uniref:SURF1 family cytochrome oxidase biogenesis protein n=1 Tax=uncultured Amnibacterium sp. TaxID=1631851 RepID=UPI0035CA119B
MEQLGRIARALVSDGRWHRYLALAIAFAIGCGLLSWWQFARRADTAAANALISSNAAAPAVPLSRLLPTSTAYRPGLQWRTVQVEGTYLTGDQLLVRNRVDPDGDPGFEVLTPLRLADGTVFVLDRGWVPIGTKQDRPDSVPAAPSGTVTVLARLQGDEGPLAGRTAPAGEIPSIDLHAVADDLGGTVFTAAYGQVRSESPAAPSAPQRIEPQPADTGVDEGTHLSYGIQWILFGLLGFGALGWSIRRDLLDSGDDVVTAAEERAVARRAKRAPSDESVEDALSER